MTKEEILAGLKNAIEKGESLEKAKQSFINAGYNVSEVQSAAEMLGGVLTEYPEIIPNPNLPQRAFIPQSEQPTPQNQIPIEKYQSVPSPAFKPLPTQRIPERKSRKGIIIALIIIFLILTGGLITTLLFKDKILEFINSLF